MRRAAARGAVASQLRMDHRLKVGLVKEERFEVALLVKARLKEVVFKDKCPQVSRLRARLVRVGVIRSLCKAERLPRGAVVKGSAVAIRPPHRTVAATLAASLGSAVRGRVAKGTAGQVASAVRGRTLMAHNSLMGVVLTVLPQGQ